MQTSEGRAIHMQDGRSMVTSREILPAGMVGGGAFDVEGNCKGMIEGIVQRPGMNIVRGGRRVMSRMDMWFRTRTRRISMRTVLRL